jgi:CheY-like chemotaxis protein
MKITGIPCCYYPTTVLLIDDDEKYLNVLKDSVIGPHKAFTKPYEAVKYLSTAHFTSLEDYCATDNGMPGAETHLIEVDLSKVHECVYSPQRFEEVSVVVVDYQMPGMNGIDFCKSIRSSNFKIILLTGEATHALAVDAFNDSIIDQFIQKSTPYLHRELSKTIAEMQFRHFQDVSAYLINSFVNNGKTAPRFLQNGHFVTFFRDILKKHHVAEYYLLNHFGDFVMITQAGKIMYFMVRDDQTFDELLRFEVEPEYLAEPSPHARALYEAIQRKEKIPFLWGLKDRPEFLSWPIYPLKTEACDGLGFYYTLIKDDAFERDLRGSEICFHKL